MELSNCKAKLQEAQAEVEALQQRAMDSQSSTAALQADVHASSAALADLTCMAQSCSLMLDHAVTGSSRHAGNPKPEVPNEGDNASDAYLLRQAASAKADLQQACDAMVSAQKEAASKQLQVEGQITQSKTSMQQAAQALQQFVLPSLSADGGPASGSVHFAEQAVITAAEVLADLAQQAVMASANMASQLKAAQNHGNNMAASNVKLQGIQDSLYNELQAEQVTDSQHCAMIANAWRLSNSVPMQYILT